MRVLIVYELVPESIEYYLMSVTSEELAKLKKCHGRYVGEGEFDEDLQIWLTEFIKRQEDCKLEMEFEQPFAVGHINCIISTGQIL